MARPVRAVCRGTCRWRWSGRSPEQVGEGHDGNKAQSVSTYPWIAVADGCETGSASQSAAQSVAVPGCHAGGCLRQRSDRQGADGTGLPGSRLRRTVRRLGLLPGCGAGGGDVVAPRVRHPRQSPIGTIAICVHSRLHSTTISARREMIVRTMPVATGGQAGAGHGRCVLRHECNHKRTQMNADVLRFHAGRTLKQCGGFKADRRRLSRPLRALEWKSEPAVERDAEPAAQIRRLRSPLR